MGEIKMSTKKVSIDSSMLVLTEEELESLINEYSFKYSHFKEINSTLIASMLKDIVLPKNSSMEQVKEILDRELLSYLCILIREHGKKYIINEIALLYNFVFENILQEIGYSKDANDMKMQILLEVIKDYIGQSNFVNMYARYAIGHINSSLSPEEIKDITKNLNQYFNNIKIEDIALLGNKIDILHSIDLNNPIFIKFVILKFGYNGYYLDDESIKTLLSLTDEEYKYYMNEAINSISKGTEDTISTVKANIK